MRTFPLRILRSPPGTWGIAIDLTAEAIAGVPPAGAVAVSGRVRLAVGSVANTVPDDAVRLLASGLGRVAAWIEDAVSGSEPITVVVHELRFAVADFQVEGLEVAIMCWAGEEFGFEPPEPEVDFDRAANRYLFSFQAARGVGRVG